MGNFLSRYHDCNNYSIYSKLNKFKSSLEVEYIRHTHHKTISYELPYIIITIVQSAPSTSGKLLYHMFSLLGATSEYNQTITGSSDDKKYVMQ